MKTCMIVAAVLWGAASLAAQDDAAIQAAEARWRAEEARRKCASLAAGIDGVSTVGMGGVGTDYKLLLAVRDTAAKRAVQAGLGGDICNGIRIVWSVKNPSVDILPPLAPPAPAVAAPDPAPSTELSDGSLMDSPRYRRPPYIIIPRPPDGDARGSSGPTTMDGGATSTIAGCTDTRYPKLEREPR